MQQAASYKDFGEFITVPKIGFFHHLMSQWLAYSLHKRARSFRTEHPQMAVFAHDFIGTEINVYGRYEHSELSALAKVIAKVDRSKLLLDIGANIGNHTLFFVGEGFENIHAFEPNPRTSSLLKFNVERCSQVTQHSIGLSNQDANLEAIIPPINAGGASLNTGHQEGHASSADRINFEVKRFDDLDIATQTVGLVKIDIEGHEPEAMEGMMGMLRRDRPLVIFECNRKTEPSSADRMMAKLNAAGYENFMSIEQPASAVPQFLPSILRRPMRLLEAMLSNRVGRCTTVSIRNFEERNYPMIVASADVLG